MTNEQKNIKKESIIKKAYIKKNNDTEKASSFDDFLKN